MTTMTAMPTDGTSSGARTWIAPRLHRSLGQLALTYLLFGGLWCGMYFSLSVSYVLTLALAIPAAGLVVRIFIFQHDCGHGSYFRPRWINNAVGQFCSLFTLTPYANWRRQHAQHHANWNNLDRRESGIDLYSTCRTTEEFAALGWRQQWLYRIGHHPLITLLILPPLVFLVLYRIPFDTPRSWKKERRAVHLTNLALVVSYGALGLAVGFPSLLAVQLPISVIASVIGVWLFSVQHKFEETLWMRRGDWNSTDAAVRRQFFSPASPCLAVVHREYRLSSCSSFRSAYAQLPPRGTARADARVPADAGPKSVRSFQGASLLPVGRGSRQDGADTLKSIWHSIIRRRRSGVWVPGLDP